MTRRRGHRGHDTGRLAVEATDETGPAHSLPVNGVCQEQNRQKPQWQEWNAIAAEGWDVEVGQGEDIEGQESLDVESEPFCA